MAINASLGVVMTRKLSSISRRLDAYHLQVREGFTAELQKTIHGLRQEIRTRDQMVDHLKVSLADLDKRYDALHTKHVYLTESHTEHTNRCIDLQQQNRHLTNQAEQLRAECTTRAGNEKHLHETLIENVELKVYRMTCIQLQVQVPLLQAALATETTQKGDLQALIGDFTSTIRALTDANSDLSATNLRLPQLEETSRWFHHFLPNIDIAALTSAATVGHAQEVATYTLLTELFGDQFYSIEIVSDKNHRGDIRLQPQKEGPSVLVEVKTYIPSSKGIMRNGIKQHLIPSVQGRQKLIDDLDQNRVRGCLSGVMIVHRSHYIPTINLGDDDGTVVVDPDHPNIFYAYVSSIHLRKTILMAVLCAYSRWGRSEAARDYTGKIRDLTSLLTTKNEDMIHTMSGIGMYVKTFGTRHKTTTSTAATLGLHLRSLRDASSDAHVAVVTRKRGRRTQD